MICNARRWSPIKPAAAATTAVSVWVGGVVMAVLPQAYDAFGPVKDLVLIAGFGFTLALLLAWTWSAPERRPAAPSPWLWALLLPAGWIWIVPAHAYAGPDWHEVQALTLTALIASAGMVALLSAELRRVVLRVWVVLGLAQAVLVLLQASGLDPFYLWTGTAGTWRVYGTMGNPNLAASLLVPLCLLSQWSQLVERVWVRRVALVVMVSAVVATGSRAGAVILALSLLPAVSVENAESRACQRLSRPVRFLIPAGVLVATALVAAAMGKGIGSVGGRWTFWRAAAQLIVRRPFLGYGLGRFQAVYPYGAAYLAAEGTPLALPASAHNDWLEFAVELGVVPALLLLATALWACWSSWKQGRVHVALALSALVLQAAWDAPLHATPTALLFFMLLGSAGSRSRAAFVGRVMPASVGLTVALIAASAVTLAGWGTIQDRVRGHVVGARAAHAASVGEWGRATHGWQQARELAPGDGVFSYWLSQGLAATGDFEAALREARRAGRTYARFDLYVLLAQLEHHVGCPARAVETLEWILEGFPRYTRARLLLDRYESDGNAVGR